MLILSRNINKVILTALISAIFAVVLSQLIPALLNRNFFAVVLLPCVAIFFVLLVVQPKKALILIILTRAAVDPMLELTRNDAQQMGLGAGVNLLIILLTGIFWIQRPHKLRNQRFMTFWLIFLFICFCAIFYSPQPAQAARLFMAFMTFMCMGALPFLLLEDAKEKFSWLKILLFSSILPVILGNIQVVQGIKRISGAFTHPNIFAFYLMLMIVISFYLLKSSQSGLSRFLKRVLRVYLLNLLVLLVFTETRNAWIALWMIFFIYGLMAERKYLFWMLALTPLALLVPTVQDRILEVVQGTTSNGDGQNSWDWRVILWQDSLIWIYRNPIFGYGLRSFVYFAPLISPIAYDRNMGAHNTYIEIAFEMGIVGLLAFLGIYLSCVTLFLRRAFAQPLGMNWEAILFFAYTVSYLITCYADNMNYYLVFNWYSWFFIGLMMASASLEKKNQNGRVSFKVDVNKNDVKS